MVVGRIALVTDGISVIAFVFINSRFILLDRPMWIGLSLLFSSAAAILMAVGLTVAPRPRQYAIALFIPGLLVVWVVSRRFVHSTSPYFRLTEVLAACESASLVWCAMVYRIENAVGRTIAATLPHGCGTLLAGAALRFPDHGLRRTLHEPDGSGRDVYVAYSAQNEQSDWRRRKSSAEKLPALSRSYPFAGDHVRLALYGKR